MAVDYGIKIAKLMATIELSSYPCYSAFSLFHFPSFVSALMLSTRLCLWMLVIVVALLLVVVVSRLWAFSTLALFATLSGVGCWLGHVWPPEQPVSIHV